MKRFWQYTVAALLGLVSLTPAWAQQGGNLGGPQAANPNAPLRIPNAQLQQNQLQQNQQNPVNPAQGVNRVPGQGRLPEQPANGQFLGNNQQGQNFNNQANAVDEFGARVGDANQVIADQLGIDPPNAAVGNMLQSRHSHRGMDQLIGSGPGFMPANLSPVYGGTSSLEEGILTGQARLLQGAGEYNRNSAEALKAREQARALYLENARTGLKTYFELKEINAQYRAANAPPPLTKEKLDQWNREDQPARLSRREYNVDTGQISWPAVLMTAPFDAERMQLELLFARRTANEFGAASDFYRLVHQSTSRMADRLKSYLQSGEKFFSDQEYVAAKNFLESLAHEARLAPDLQGIAAK
jgi:hypothetical protein